MKEVSSLKGAKKDIVVLFVIFIAVSRRYKEKFGKRSRRLGFTERIAENNAEKVKDYENVSEYLA